MPPGLHVAAPKRPRPSPPGLRTPRSGPWRHHQRWQRLLHPGAASCRHRLLHRSPIAAISNAEAAQRRTAILRASVDRQTNGSGAWWGATRNERRYGGQRIPGAAVRQAPFTGIYALWAGFTDVGTAPARERNQRLVASRRPPAPMKKPPVALFKSGHAREVRIKRRILAPEAGVHSGRHEFAAQIDGNRAPETVGLQAARGR